jgi:hypothetical protein
MWGLWLCYKSEKNFYEQINFINEVSNIQLYYNKLKRNKFCILGAFGIK